MVSMQERVKQILSTLTPREEKIIKMLFGVDRPINTEQGIAEYFGVTKERIVQIVSKCKRKLEYGSRKDYQLKFDFEQKVIIDLEC
jgi:RNA polymerase primary sigma factor